MLRSARRDGRNVLGVLPEPDLPVYTQRIV
jgi:hypothetical protein